MATRAKDTAPPGKEKRGISPSHPIPHHLRSPNSSTTNSPVRKRADSITSNKNVPNYLKPTMSSSGDSSIHNKPTLTRRRSFDKPPIATLQKITNPKERILRASSSFSGKTSSPSQKPLSRVPHMTKDATSKQRSTGTYARPGTIKKTTTTATVSKKQEVSSTSHNDTHKSRNDQDGHNGSTPKASITNSSHAAGNVIPQDETGQDDTYKSRNDEDGPNDSTPKESIITNSPYATENVIPQAELSDQEDNHELPVTDTESDVIINSEAADADADADAGDDNSAIEDQEEHNGHVTNAEIFEENQEIIKMDEPEEEQLVEETSTSNPKEPEEITNELHLKENTVKVVDENQQEKEEDEGRNQGKEAVMTEEGEAVQETNATVASSKPQCQVVQGKKESVVSNDVIEETASKLRAQRKNRVKALAGAFETVISLQEPNV